MSKRRTARLHDANVTPWGDLSPEERRARARRLRLYWASQGDEEHVEAVLRMIAAGRRLMRLRLPTGYVLAALALLAPAVAGAGVVMRGAGSGGGLASAYGPGLYGNRLACGGRLTPATYGVAHRWLPCGTPVRICYRARCRNARVVDRGPYVAGRELDLTEALVHRFGASSARHWGVRYVRWSRR